MVLECCPFVSNGYEDISYDFSCPCYLYYGLFCGFVSSRDVVVNVQLLKLHLLFIILHNFGYLPYSPKILASALHLEALATVPSLTVPFVLI